MATPLDGEQQVLESFWNDLKLVRHKRRQGGEDLRVSRFNKEKEKEREKGKEEDPTKKKRRVIDVASSSSSSSSLALPSASKAGGSGLEKWIAELMKENIRANHRGKEWDCEGVDDDALRITAESRQIMENYNKRLKCIEKLASSILLTNDSTKRRQLSVDPQHAINCAFDIEHALWEDIGKQVKDEEEKCSSTARFHQSQQGNLDNWLINNNNDQQRTELENIVKRSSGEYGKHYRASILRLSSNLKDNGNEILREQVIKGIIPANELIHKTPQELNPLKAIKRAQVIGKLAQQYTRSSTFPAAASMLSSSSTEGIMMNSIKCRFCGSNSVTVTTRQPRQVNKGEIWGNKDEQDPSIHYSCHSCGQVYSMDTV